MPLQRFGERKLPGAVGTTQTGKTSLAVNIIVASAVPPALPLLGGGRQLLNLVGVANFEVSNDRPPGLTLLLALVTSPELGWRRSVILPGLLLDNLIVILLLVLAVVGTALSSRHFRLFSSRWGIYVSIVELGVLMVESTFEIIVCPGLIVFLF